jgi:hypothetical protein
MEVIPKVIRKTVAKESIIIQEGTGQQVTEKHEQFSENQQRNEIEPEFAPQQCAQGDRRGLQDPESLPSRLTAEKRSAWQRHSIRNRPARFAKATTVFRSRSATGAIQRKHFEVIEIDDDQGDEQESCDHWVLSRRKVLMSFTISA